MDQAPGLKLGILGGGQLARMMALAAHPYGIIPQIYAASKVEPAPQVTPTFFQGDLKEASALKNFLENCDVVTFESEFLEADLLEKLSQETRVPIFPAPQLMGLLQDRLTQKQLLEKYKIPTAPYRDLKTRADWEDLRRKPQEKNKGAKNNKENKHLGSEVVIKQRRFGYDGYGTYFLKTHLPLPEWNQTCEELITKTSYGFIGEKKIPFRRELALLLARDRHGKIIDFPLVESKQTRARCDWVMGPVKHPKEKTLRTSLKLFLKKIDYIGIMAFELFDTGPELLVNEIAPRVHNSGHYSQNALSLTQFQAHVLAVCGYKLSTPQVLSPFAMANLLGTSSQPATWSEKWGSMESSLEGAIQSHWYGKSENRKDRKMGHINALGTSPQAALKLALTARRKVKI